MPDAKKLKTRIVNGIIEALEAIDSTNGYWYDPTIVAPRPVDPEAYALVFDQHDTLIYLVSPGDIREQHYASGGTQQAVLDVMIFGSYLYDIGDVDPLTYDSGSRDEVRDAMVDDIKRAIWADASLGLGAFVKNVDITDIRNIYFNWPELQMPDGPDLAAVEVRVEVTYHYKRGDVS